jgi:2-polyprenyl-3-methyl-5-hydroxy-6-metoxy-1,4-benzoquinol methylase
MQNSSEDRIIASWQNNVQAWVAAIRNGEIASRTLVTNQAIVDAVLQHQPKTVLDIGCGEGWLVRELASRDMDVLGIDAVPEFIELARQTGAGRFRTLAYEDITVEILKEKYDVVVCNFSLLGKESVEHLFQHIPSLLNKGGALIVQTLHPVAACGDQAYQDGWREGSWAGFSDQFCDPAPWYFRTNESWQALFEDYGFVLTQIHEPISLKTHLPASIIFIGESAT